MNSRMDFMQEEWDEIAEAYETADLGEVFDGLIDLMYFVVGTMYLMGVPCEAGWRMVHNANMTKVLQSEGGEALDPSKKPKMGIIKPKDWVAPDLSALL